MKRVSYRKIMVLMSLVTLNLLAQEDKSILVRSQEALQNDQPQIAYELLTPAYADKSLSNQGLFLLGMSAKETGKLKESEAYFSELLEKEPNALRVKLELAEVYYLEKDQAKAKRLLQDVKSANPPAKVGENIDRFLATIDASSPKKWNAYVGAGYMYDTNANQGPSIDSVLMYDLPFTLDQNAKNTRDWALTLKAGADYSYDMSDEWSWQNSIGVSTIDYRKVNTYDSTNLSLSTGFGYKEGDWTFALPYVVNRIKIGHDKDYYSFSHGIVPQVSYALSQELLLISSLALQKKHYYDNNDRDGTAITFSPSLRYLVDNHSYVTFGGYLGHENSGVQTFENNSKGVNVGYFNAINAEWSIYISPSYSKTDYDGIEAAYATGRVDKRFDATTNLNYQIQEWAANVTLSYTYTKNSSTIDMYDYNRQQTMLTLTKNF